MTAPQLIAFDFDGVICDGLIEYFQTAWQAYVQLFNPANQAVSQEAPDGLAEKFYPLRPVIETGWEMPALVRALIDSASDKAIIQQWPAMALSYLEAANLTKAQSAQTLDGVRDQWINTDLSGWLGLHRFYPGMIDKLADLLAGDIPVYIVSTKEGRFIKALLAKSGLDFPEERIIGKEVKRPKYETLRILKKKHFVEQIWFVEDRLPALESVVAQSDLQQTELFLADWGYNLAPDRDLARQHPRIHLLSLQQVVQKFDGWMSLSV